MVDLFDTLYLSTIFASLAARFAGMEIGGLDHPPQ
jgi:hypothetical protein